MPTKKKKNRKNSPPPKQGEKEIAYPQKRQLKVKNTAVTEHQQMTVVSVDGKKRKP